MSECPYCAEPVELDTEQCPHCGEYLVERATTARGSSRSVLLVILVIIGVVLGGCVALGVLGYVGARSNQKKARAAMLQVKNQALAERLGVELEHHAAKTGELPAELGEIGPNVTDAWGNPFVYEVTEEGFKLTSYGADGAPGGAGDDTDVTQHYDIRDD